jgi:hypothetical protein
MSEMDGFEVKRKGKKFEVHCKQCGCRWKSSDWLTVMLKHSKHHGTQRPIDIRTKPQGT